MLYRTPPPPTEFNRALSDPLRTDASSSPYLVRDYSFGQQSDFEGQTLASLICQGPRGNDNSNSQPSRCSNWHANNAVEGNNNVSMFAAFKARCEVAVVKMKETFGRAFSGSQDNKTDGMPNDTSESLNPNRYNIEQQRGRPVPNATSPNVSASWKPVLVPIVSVLVILLLMLILKAVCPVAFWFVIGSGVLLSASYLYFELQKRNQRLLGDNCDRAMTVT